MKYNSTNRFLILLLLLFCIEVGFVCPLRAGNDRSALSREQAADRHFLRQKFDRAMSLYEKAVADAASPQVEASIHAKAARLYYMLRRYPEAAKHFGAAMRLEEGALLVNDVCDYIDVLRIQGMTRQAEEVCLRYAYQSVYSRNQRYNNMLDALSRRHELSADGTYEVVAERTCNTSGAEYWISMVGGQLWYARSDSRFNDPGKRFYPDTKFFSVFGGTKRRSVYTDMGIEGPFALLPGGRMIVTAVEDRTNRRIDRSDSRLNPYVTSLMIISGDRRRKRSGKSERLFASQEGVSYCHPCVFDDGYALLFASDAPGGMGGYDLYISRWDDGMRLWSDPENLGPEINTAGDELFPAFFDGKLYFASNGQPGCGGYDIYSFEYDWDNEAFIPGTLTHLPAPVNSPYNDFSLAPMDGTWGYFISDRNIPTGGDIYSYRLLNPSPTSTLPFFGMSELNAVTGGRMLLTGRVEQTEQRQPQNVRFPNHAPKGVVMTLYFDFNSAGLTEMAASQIDRFLRAEHEYEIRSFSILGYADEMGSEEYNRELSHARGESVAESLRRKFRVPMKVKGCGRTLLPESADADDWKYNAILLPDRELSYRMPMLSHADRIRRNQPARRVDVFINISDE